MKLKDTLKQRAFVTICHKTCTFTMNAIPVTGRVVKATSRQSSWLGAATGNAGSTPTLPISQSKKSQLHRRIWPFHAHCIIRTFGPDRPCKPGLPCLPPLPCKRQKKRCSVVFFPSCIPRYGAQDKRSQLSKGREQHCKDGIWHWML